ncbi:DUF2063 domain-containing protein [Falsihalocynthiibacter sp. SS001]|uniref:HvfC/BufC N-terminal domain-containing protein n=1 Tax=Falsihalocynthiibacter sp. SS001 TaxID=3349698 RepID=UPI0036D35D85
MVTVSQSEFITALLDPDQAVPSGLRSPDDSTAGKRFSVYRNNVAVSLTEALTQAFPILTRIVGEEFFNALAGVFLREHPPQSPLMMFYGSRMPSFLETFEPVAHLPYLADVARLELALRQSYHAADTTPIAPETLQNMPPDMLMKSQVSFAPTVHILQSRWPLHAIYLANTRPDAPAVTPGAQDVIVTRPDFDPQVSLLPRGGAAFISSLQNGARFSEAFDTAGATQGFDLSQVLGILFSGGAITKIAPQ